MLVNTFWKKMLDPAFSLNKCWCTSFQKNVDSTFMKNVDSTFCLKNVGIFSKEMLQHFVINNYDVGWFENNKQQIRWTLMDWKVQSLSNFHVFLPTPSSNIFENVPIFLKMVELGVGRNSPKRVNRTELFNRKYWLTEFLVIYSVKTLSLLG
jgi:hypothetical protein